MTDDSPTQAGRDDDALIDWGLQELLEDREPTDLADAVHAALREERTPLSPTRPRQPWLLAACILLGAAVVLTTALWQPATDSDEASDWQWPETPYRVHSLQDALAAPRDTRVVVAAGIDDAVVAALTRLKHLEGLAVHMSANETFGLGLKMPAPKNPKYVTNASWQHFAKFTKLRALRLSGASLVARIRTGKGDDVVTALEHLPLLEELSLRFLDCDDAVLQRLPRLRSLRRLDLDWNHGFGQAGLKALLDCRQLRSVSLEGCQQIYGNWIGHLAKMPRLERLNVRSIDHMNWRAGMAEPKDAEGVDLQTRMRRVADSLSVGVNDGTLQSLAQAPRLRVLEMSNGKWTAAGLSHLGKSASLRELDMFGGQVKDHSFVQHLPRELTRLEVCGDFTDDFCRAVREHLPNLRHLNISACYKITDAGLGEILHMPSLRVLDMRQMYGLTERALDVLVAAKQLEELDLRHNEWLTKERLQQLKAALPELEKVQAYFE